MQLSRCKRWKLQGRAVHFNGDGDVTDEGDESDGGRSDDGSEEDTDTASSHTVLGSSVIHVLNFEAPPSDWTSQAPGPDYELSINPLASVRPVGDITKFYAPSNEDNEDNDTTLYVINVNYAGNEMHESAVRIVMRDDQGFPNRIGDAAVRAATELLG